MRGYTVDEWSKLDENDVVIVAQNLCHAGSHSLSFSRVYAHTYCGKHFWIAEFVYHGKIFVYIPGNTVELGFDKTSFTPSESQLLSYQGSVDEYGLPDNIMEHIKSITTPCRTVTIPAFFVEASPQEIGLTPLDVNTPEIQYLIRHYRPITRQLEVHKQYRVIHHEDGTYSAYKIIPTTHAQLCQTLHEHDFRLVTSDEWEYVCSAGTRTLFRWGDDCPCDRYPTDHPADEVRGKKEGGFSKGKILDWDLHLQKNLFGLTIAQNPYNWEVVDEPHSVRGGDGGCNICGGVGFFMGWLPLASSYVEQSMTGWREEDISNSFMRRVIEVE
jgi:hypothetical protein